MLSGGCWKNFIRGLLVAMLVVVALIPSVLELPASAASPVHGAGLVIRHGNGKVVYAYVEFSGRQISGAELLARSGLSVKISVVPGLGEEVCEIQQEGCPPSSCYCKSYASPAYYWHYYRLDASGQWVYQQEGPTTTVVHDGDVDGWSWTADQPNLPKTNIDRIAKVNGIQRQSGTATPIAKTAPVIASPTPSVGRESTATESTSPVAHAVEGNDGGSFTTVKTSSKTSSGPSNATVAEIAVALAVLAVAAGWITLRRRRDTP